MERVVVICGPTASGKTALAVELAEKLGAEIVSADSQQCYRGLDAATAKPTAEERARARHHLLDVGEFEGQGVPALHERLRGVDPAAAAKILPNDRVRIERALEVHALSGRPLSELQREHGFAEARYDAALWFLDPPRDVLRSRIETRTRRMFADGS